MYDQYGRWVPGMGYGMQMQQEALPVQSQIVKVNGRGGAEAYRMAPNSSALLLDTGDPIVWLKATDGAGYPTLTPYQITPYEEPKPVDTADIISRIERLEAIVNGKSDAGST